MCKSLLFSSGKPQVLCSSELAIVIGSNTLDYCVYKQFVIVPLYDFVHTVFESEMAFLLRKRCSFPFLFVVMQKACKRNVCRLFIGGAAGIRTLVPLRTNGFQGFLRGVKSPYLFEVFSDGSKDQQHNDSFKVRTFSCTSDSPCSTFSNRREPIS